MSSHSQLYDDSFCGSPNILLVGDSRGRQIFEQLTEMQGSTNISKLEEQ